jgi:hypothetical protein
MKSRQREESAEAVRAKADLLKIKISTMNYDDERVNMISRTIGIAVIAAASLGCLIGVLVTVFILS